MKVNSWLLTGLLGAAILGTAQAQPCPQPPTPGGPAPAAAPKGPEGVPPGSFCADNYTCVLEPVKGKKMVPHYYMREVPVCLPRCPCHGHKPGCDGNCGGACGADCDAPPCGKIRCKRVLYKRMCPEDTEVLRCRPKEVPPAPPCAVQACPAPCAGQVPAGVPAALPPVTTSGPTCAPPASAPPAYAPPAPTSSPAPPGGYAPRMPPAR
jgi:hypothetical protein